MLILKKRKLSEGLNQKSKTIKLTKFINYDEPKLLSSSAEGTYLHPPLQQRSEHGHQYVGVPVSTPKDMDERHVLSSNQINQMQGKKYVSRAFLSQERHINMVHQDSLNEKRFSENLEKKKINPRKDENITSFCSCNDSKNCSKFHLLISKFCKGASRKEKARTIIQNSQSRRLEGSLSHPDAANSKLNLSTHRAALSAFYPNVCSIEDREISKREVFLSSHPSTLSKFYFCIRDIEGKGVTREERSGNHLAHLPARVPQAGIKGKNYSQVLGWKPKDDSRTRPSASIRMNENSFQYRSNTGRGFAA